MTWENPIKIARLCFFRTGHSKEHFALADDTAAVQRLISFLQSSDAVIIELENYAAYEIEALRRARGRTGTSLFATPGCFRGRSGSKTYCDKACPLKSGD